MNIKSLQLKRALRSVLLVLLLSAVGMGKMDAQNLIVNPDFESGNTGFFSDYQYMTTGSVDAGQYCVDVNSTGHGVGMVGWPTILGYGGSGNYMLVNGFGGNTNPTKAAWKQTVTVTPNTDYIFSCQVVNLAQSVFGYSPNPAILRLKINGSTVGGDYTVAQNNSWHEWSVSWHNGNETQVEIAIYDVYTGDSGLGDDFGLDHLSFTPQATYSVNAVDDDVSLCVAYYQTYQIDVLANDIITPSDQISGATVQVIQNPTHGNATWNNSTRKINYTFLDQGYYGGLDQFKYRVTIPHGEYADAWVYVNTGREPNVGWIDPPGTICAGGPLGISIPTVEPDQGSGQWERSQTQNGNYAAFDENNVPLSMNGWWVRYTATNNCGQGSSNRVQISVTSYPTIGIILEPDPIYAGNSFNLTIPSIQSNGSTIINQGWQIAAQQDGPYSAFNNNNVPYTYNGYWIRYFAENDCGISYSNSVQITVYQNDNNIVFADANVKAICVANWDTNGDGELSYDEAVVVTDLGYYFHGNSQITSFDELQYFTGLTSIGYYAFSGCSGLTSLIIPNSVASIVSEAFRLCSGLTSLTIPNSVTWIGYGAFEYCSGLTSLTIPNSVTEIGFNAFVFCSGLEQIIVDEDNPSYDSRENCNAIIETSTNTLITGCKNTIIPNSATWIGDNAFSGCTGLTSLTIPNSVTSIGYYAFEYCSGLTSLTIPNSVISIGYDAFEFCSGLGQIIVDEDNPSYDSRENCNAIIETSTNTLITGCKNTIIPNSVTSIGNHAFSGCTGLTSLTIPNSVTSISGSAFEYCRGLSIITVLAETPPTLSSGVFYNLDTSIPVYVPCGFDDAYTSLLWGGFSDFFGLCAGEITITVNPTEGGTVTGTGYYEGGSLCTLTAIPNEGFSFLNWMENGTIVSNDSEYSFVVSGDRELVANFVEGELCTVIFELFDSYGDGYTGNYLVVTDENGSQQLTVESGSSAVYTLPFLTSSHITLTWIVGSYPEDCSFTVSYSNGNVIYHGENLNESFSYEFDVDCGFSPVDNIVFADPNVKAICVANWDTNGDGELSYDEAAAVTDLGQVFRENTEITSFEELQFFTGLTTIGNFAFSGCSCLTGDLTIPNSVISIGSCAFLECSRLSSIEIPNSVTSIEYSAFSNCTGLTSIDIPDSVTSIEFDAFWRCTSLTTVTIPQSVTSMGENPFAGCSGLEHIIVDSRNTAFDSRENCNAIIETSTNALVTGCKNTTIPNSVTSIGFAAFSGCSGLTSINIPNSVVSIGSFAFVNCNSLTSIAMSNSLTSIGFSAFWYCSGLTSIDIPNSVISIAESAFESCSGLTTVTIPNSVTSIESNPFPYCSSLEQIVVDLGNTVYDSRENCNAIINTNTNELITGCKNTIIPNSVESIGWFAFLGCSGLTAITIPNSVTSIESDAFGGCSRLISVAIPSSVAYIGYGTFHECYGLDQMLMFRTTPPLLEDDSFYDTNFPIYVPYESLNDYKTATNWSSYEDRIFPMAYTTIPGYGEGEGNYRFIASPLVENTDPTAVDNMITETAYDFYRFDQSEEAEWQNYKYPENTPNFFLTNGQGYLYANAEDVNLIFKGAFNEDDTKEVGLAYDATATFAGWNLMGNPFPVNAYANKSYYTMNEEGTAIEPNMVSSATAIPVCTGVMVMAEAEGETVVFSTEAPEAATNQGCLQIALSQAVELVETPIRKQDGPSTGSGTLHDKAIVSFNAGDRLEKFVFNKENAVISIPQGGKELAIACSNKQGEMPLNFKASKNGEYTLTIHPEAVELDYLHLIDNLTGADVDLLVSPAYTFTAKTTDYASRFRLVFSGNEADGPSTSSGTFAFISNGNIIITDGPSTGSGACILQIVDVMGRIIVSTDAARNVSTCGIVPGVYVLRLINGDDVRTQKIVVR